MILDYNLIFDTAATLSLAANGTTSSLSVVDLHNARDMGQPGSNIPKLMCLVTSSVLSTNSATIQVIVQGSTDNTNFTNMAQSDTISMANATAGSRLLDIDLPRPAPGQSLPRYIGVQFKAATGAITSGTIYSALVINRQDAVYYPPGIVVAN